MFLPMTRAEMVALGWDALDVVLVTGDSYIDSPFIGVAVIGKVLVDAGYRVGVVAQPDATSGKDIGCLGEPRLFWGVTAGSLDSMVANRTASGMKRMRDDYTPGGINGRRPDRATLIYCNLIRRHFKNTVPIVLGGIEASLRRVAHYDYWSDKIRRSILVDTRADYLLYGMAESSVVELAAHLRDKVDPRGLRGLCYLCRDPPDDCEMVPSYEDVAADKGRFTDMFHRFYASNDPFCSSVLVQKHASTYLIQNPPPPSLTVREMDRIYDLDYEREAHPVYGTKGHIKALETIRFSIATHRGCYGECRFCSIAVHQGRSVTWRSERSILAEARRLVAHPKFKGTIHDVGGPTANMYGFECRRKRAKGACPDRSCLSPEICSSMPVDHGPQIHLLDRIRRMDGVKRVFVASGVRHDLVLADRKHGRDYLRALVRHHVSGQLKVAPEHTEARVLRLMGKPGTGVLVRFRELFMKLTAACGKKQFLTYYMIAGHPGCELSDMKKLRQFATRTLKHLPEQTQLFTPTPSTYSSLMYWTERDPFTDEAIFVEKTFRGREAQRRVLTR